MLKLRFLLLIKQVEVSNVHARVSYYPMDRANVLVINPLISCYPETSMQIIRKRRDLAPEND